MAEIKIEEKPRRRFPLWLLIIPVLLALLLLRNRGDDTDDRMASDTAATAQSVGGDVAPGAAATGAAAGAAGSATGVAAITRFAEWANEGGNTVLPQESEENHPYTTQGIRLMADALAQAAAGRADHSAAIQQLRSHADMLQRSSGGKDEHADHAHAAFTDAARLVGELGGNATELTTAANAIRRGEPLSPQGERVRTFFRQAAAAIQPLGGSMTR